MSATSTCTYCGQDLALHDPVHVEETRDGEQVPAGSFCNYACLQSHIDEADLTVGTCCEWSPDPE